MKTLCVCSIDKDGTHWPMQQLHLDQSEANSLLSWMKRVDPYPNRFKIVDMKNLDLTKLCLKAFTKEAQEKIMEAFKKVQSKG